jgi:hypothetical protein
MTYRTKFQKTLSVFSYKCALVLFFCLFVQFLTYAQTPDDSVKREKIKTGFNFGALPAIAYDSDLGFKYGALANFYDYGDGTIYPMYRHSLYLEWSRTTKGSGINQVIYDSEYLIPNIRTTLQYDLFTEKALDFYGFNGYEAWYNKNFEDENSNEYISRMFYRHERKLTHLKADFQGNILQRKLRWLAGLEYFNHKIATVNIKKLNKGKDKEDLLPDTALLYEKFIEWGIIPPDQKDGGDNTFLKLGLIYDTRDNEPNPMSGIWTEAILFQGIPQLGTRKYSFSKLIITHRQYFTLYPEILNAAFRVGYQTKLSGTIPFYMLPYIYNSNITRDGLGGAKTLRGILRNRVVGEDYLYGNIELRWKFYRHIIWKQNIYIALAGFYDIGRVTKNYAFNANAEASDYLSKGNKETWHPSVGAGLYFAMNQNFVVNFSYGKALNKNDGIDGLYINLNFLY